MKLATADIDSLNTTAVTAAVFCALQKKARYIEIKKSSNKGYHVSAYFPNHVSKKRLRLLMGDDPFRWHYDRKEAPEQILFSRKGKVKKWNQNTSK